MQGTVYYALMVTLVLTHAAQLSVVIPCGTAAYYTAANTTSGTQFIIRNCTGSTRSGSTVAFAATYLSLNFNSSFVLPPANITVVMEHSVSVNLRLSGNGSTAGLGGAAMMSGLTLIVTNVTNPYDPQPRGLVSCALSTSVWCLSMIQVQCIGLKRLTVTVVSATMDRSLDAFCTSLW